MSTNAITLDSFDLSVSAKDDLFRHVNGRWADTTTIPEDKSSWGTFHQLRETSERAVREIIDQIDQIDTPDAGRIRALYSSFMDTERVEDLGVAPLAPLLARVDEIASVSDLARFWGWSLRHGIGGVVDMDNDADPGDPGRYLVFVGQSGIGLPDEEYYRLDEHAETRQAYRSHLAKMFTLARVADPTDQAERVFALETAIAAHHWDKVRTRDMVQMYYPQTWGQFVADSPSLCWEAFLAGAELPAGAVGEVINCQRTFLGELAGLVTPDTLEDWRAWARWQIIDSLAGFCSADLVEQNFDFYGRTLQGIPQLRERWKRGVSLVEGVLGEAVGRIYVEQHFPPRVKAQADALVANLLEAYRRSISALDWMTEETRAEALAKLARFRPKIGYPNKWRDYSGLNLDPGDLIGNVLAANSFELDHMIDQLSGPIDPEEWLMYPQTVNAYYHPLRNEIVFPAAILQPPFFNPDADDAVNYGGIGAVIGHEIGHGFDDQGSTCDGDGRLRNWWSDQDRAAFTERTTRLVEQYNVLSPAAAPDVRVNGELTLGENIGDLGGLFIAYEAWQIATEGVELPEIDGYTPAQRFFLGWAQSWQTITRPEAARERIATDPHSPDELRCNQVARNVTAFHEAFGVDEGDGMWLDPAERVRIW